MYREISLSKIKLYSNTLDVSGKVYCYKFSLSPWQEELNDTTLNVVRVIKLLKEKYSNNFILFKSDCDKVIDFLKTFFGHAEFLKNYFYYKSVALCELIKSPRYSNKTKLCFFL